MQRQNENTALGDLRPPEQSGGDLKVTFFESLIVLRSIPGCIKMQEADFLLTLHTATRLTLMLCILFRDEFSLFLLIQES